MAFARVALPGAAVAAAVAVLAASSAFAHATAAGVAGAATLPLVLGQFEQLNGVERRLRVQRDGRPLGTGWGLFVRPEKMTSRYAGPPVVHHRHELAKV